MSGSNIRLKVAALPEPDLAFLNKAFVSPAQYHTLSSAAGAGSGASAIGPRGVYVSISNDVFLVGYSDKCASGDFCISGPQRMSAKVQLQVSAR